MGDRPTVLERYSTALLSSDLSVSTERTGDADLLIAAGIAAQADERTRQSIMLYRMVHSGHATQEQQLVMIHYAYRWVKSQMFRPGRDRLPKMDHAEVMDACAVVLIWWLSKRCPHCKGRRFELASPGAQVTSQRICKHCDGTGNVSLDRLAGDHGPAARWLANEFDLAIDRARGAMVAALYRRDVPPAAPPAGTQLPSVFKFGTERKTG